MSTRARRTWTKRKTVMSAIAITSANAAISSAAAHTAEVSRCKIIIKGYDAKTATITEMREYAACVNTVYPAPMTPDEVVVAKFIFVLALLGMVAGLIYCKRSETKTTTNWGGGFTVTHERSSVVGYLLAGSIGFVGLPIAVIVVAGIMAGIIWLFQG